MTEGPDLCAGCGHDRSLHALDYGPCTVPACKCGAFAELDAPGRAPHDLLQQVRRLT